jgi:histone acetyltransferase 1
MAHQIFGEKEQIFGYKDLQIDIFYSAGPLDIYFNVEYSKRVDEEFEQIKPDPVNEAIVQLFPTGGGYFTNLEEFMKTVEKNEKNFKPLGDKVNEFTVQDRSFEVYLCDMKTPNFLKYHARFESLIMWYIDAASRIIHDQQFVFFVV